MRINAIAKDEVQLSLDANELVCLSNVLYFYEKYHDTDPDFTKPKDTFHDLNKQIIIAMNLAQYGRLDSHAIQNILSHELAARPESQLAKNMTAICERLAETHPDANK